jgi:hypothetical protein
MFKLQLSKLSGEADFQKETAGHNTASPFDNELLNLPRKIANTTTFSRNIEKVCIFGKNQSPTTPSRIPREIQPSPW